MKLFDKTLTKLERTLDVRLARQNVLAGNLANVDTPGYVPRELDFAQAMEQATGPTATSTAALTRPAGSQEGFIPVYGEGNPPPLPPSAIAGPVAGAVISPGSPLKTGLTTSPGIDGNGVDLDRTMVALAENALKYGAAARAVQKKLGILRYVASDGNA